jgi:hypothetical protein
MDWIALMAALPALLTSLGDHLPGLLVAAAVIYLYVQREREIAVERKANLEEAKACKVAAEALAEKVVAAIQTVSERLVAYERAMELDELIRELAADRRGEGGHANAGTSGQN